MRYKLLGNSGLRVSELALGTMTFGEEWGWGAPRDECRRMLERYAEAGGNFVDTANKYTDGTSERWVGELVGDDRDRWVVATKYTLSTRDGDPNSGGTHRKNLVQSLEESLDRLDLDWVDLLWVHAWDRHTPVEETMRALDDVVRAGTVLYLGISDAPAWWVARANTLAEERGWTPFSALQIKYSLAERTPERELLPMARALGLAVTPWGILGSGVLTGKYVDDEATEGRASQLDRLTEREQEIARVVVEVSRDAGCTPSQAAIAWLRSRPGLVIPILGVRTVEQLEDNLGALDVRLEEGQLERLDEATRIDLGFPMGFLDEEPIVSYVYSDVHERIDGRER